MIHITKLDQERFTEGDCHILARAIHKHTGWPIWCFGDKTPDEHAFVRSPDGRCLDIDGWGTVEQMKAIWECDQMRSFTVQELGDDWGWIPSFGLYSTRRARQLAPYLVSS